MVYHESSKEGKVLYGYSLKNDVVFNKMIKEFDPSIREHVVWLKKLLDAKIEDKVTILNENPMKMEMPPFEVIQIIFGLSMRYTQAVFNKTAVVI